LINSIDHNSIQKIREQNNLEKYGVKNVSQLSWVQEKLKGTKINRYGTSSPRKMPGAEEKFKETWNSEEYKNSDQYKHYLETRIGKNNGRAKPIVFRGIKYDYIQEAVEKTGISRYLILKEIKEKQ
jgi:hypothetical protein